MIATGQDFEATPDNTGTPIRHTEVSEHVRKTLPNKAGGRPAFFHLACLSSVRSGTDNVHAFSESRGCAASRCDTCECWSRHFRRAGGNYRHFHQATGKSTE